MKKPEYLKFVEADSSWLKTRRVEVRSVNSNVLLGMISWFPRWRQYTFWPEPATIFNDSCLNEISLYVSRMTTDHRKMFQKIKMENV